MKVPPEYMLPLLHSIETTVISVLEDYPKLRDQDVETAYGQLKKFFQKKAYGKEIDEPLSHVEKIQILMDEILNTIDLREELEGDIHLINNPNIQPAGSPIPSLAAFYTMAFKRLEKSVRFWRKMQGQSYIKFIQDHVV